MQHERVEIEIEISSVANVIENSVSTFSILEHHLDIKFKTNWMLHI